MLDGNTVCSCLMLAADAVGHEITTVEGIGTPEKMSPCRRRSWSATAYQCGFCTPGMVVASTAFLNKNKKTDPSIAEIKAGLAGNLCRCGTYGRDLPGGPAGGEATVKPVAAARGGVAHGTAAASDAACRSDDQHTMKAGTTANAQPLEVNISEGDLKPWDLDTKFKVVGKNQPRLDGPQKVTGKAKYTFDISLPGMLWAKMVRASVPAAEIVKIDTSKAEAMPGVKAVWTTESRTVRFAGQDIAAVAATSIEIAEEAARASWSSTRRSRSSRTSRRRWRRTRRSCSRRASCPRRTRRPRRARATSSFPNPAQVARLTKGDVEKALAEAR
jgi:hypothetical protein